MKKIGFLALSALALAACGNGDEQRAQVYLDQARQAYEQGRYSEAKLQIDSVKILYPKAFKVRDAGIGLMQQVELKEQQQTLAFLDSMLLVKQQEFEAVQAKYVLEKDTAYQKIGNYFYPSQTVEKNINRSFLRVQVDERGQMTLTSIYCGTRNIHHYAVKVKAADGSFAETPASKDVYETTDLGVRTEKADYKLGEDGNVIGFIALNKDRNITLEYIGDRTYRTSVSAADRKAIAEVYALAQILGAREEIRKQIRETNLKIDFVTRKIQEREAARSEQP